MPAGSGPGAAAFVEVEQRAGGAMNGDAEGDHRKGDPGDAAGIDREAVIQRVGQVVEAVQCRGCRTIP